MCSKCSYKDLLNLTSASVQSTDRNECHSRFFLLLQCCSHVQFHKMQFLTKKEKDKVHGKRSIWKSRKRQKPADMDFFTLISKEKQNKSNKIWDSKSSSFWSQTNKKHLSVWVTKQSKHSVDQNISMFMRNSYDTNFSRSIKVCNKGHI